MGLRSQHTKYSGIRNMKGYVFGKQDRIMIRFEYRKKTRGMRCKSGENGTSH